MKSVGRTYWVSLEFHFRANWKSRTQLLTCKKLHAWFIERNHFITNKTLCCDMKMISKFEWERNGMLLKFHRLVIASSRHMTLPEQYLRENFLERTFHVRVEIRSSLPRRNHNGTWDFSLALWFMQRFMLSRPISAFLFAPNLNRENDLSIKPPHRLPPTPPEWPSKVYCFSFRNIFKSQKRCPEKWKY